ncbi:hypothetical protein BDV23DRAFT_192903 [Aspergillus alliaceus]|uniref:BZIP domain-containing protein n=1 Tax=Petromyces alliaceus TaxID=209559 RepID=A0A5N7CPW4_PETAA|nr:hypothetical protein BDV23DRAFT_192903 [Aspergillus alliaceus]
MEPSPNNGNLSASDRKRMRDRKAQKVLREKREGRIKALEDRVAYCERHHGAGWMQQMMAAMDTLRRENEMLRARQERLRAVVSSWEREESGLLSANTHNHPIQKTGQQLLLPGASYRRGGELSPTWLRPLNISHGEDEGRPLPEPSRLSEDDRAEDTSLGPNSTFTNSVDLLYPTHTAPVSVPAWRLTPINEGAHIPPISSVTCTWLANPDLVAACPPFPSPLDLLHGTRRNYLADKISQVIRLRAIRQPERLANGWLIYVYSKWRVSQSPETFSRIPPFLRPVLMQIQRGHPSGLDVIVFPQIRINLLENWDMVDFPEIIDYLACCQKVRWPWGEDILERDGDDNFRIRREFYDVFMRESGWGLTPEFIENCFLKPILHPIGR